MPAAELLEWMEYETIEPFGAWRDNWHTALLASILANSHRDPKQPPIQMREFFYKDAESVKEEQRKRDMATIAFFESKVKN